MSLAVLGVPRGGTGPLRMALIASLPRVNVTHGVLCPSRFVSRQSICVQQHWVGNRLPIPPRGGILRVAVLLREPIARAYSSYMHYKRLNLKLPIVSRVKGESFVDLMTKDSRQRPGKFCNSLQAKNSIFCFGNYADLMSQMNKKRVPILVLISERVSRNTLTEYNNLLSFGGISPIPKLPVNRYFRRRYKTIDRASRFEVCKLYAAFQQQFYHNFGQVDEWRHSCG